MPDYLYIAFKYRAINKHFINSIITSSLYFSKRDRLNDPFDSMIDIKGLITFLLEDESDKDTRQFLQQIASDRDFFQRFDDGYKNFGICSFSTDLKSTLMWSHYADEHKGVALRYEFPEEFLNNPSEILGVAPMNYESNTVSTWIKSNAELFENDHYLFVTNLIKLVLTAKAPDWSHENEGRIIRAVDGPFEVPRSMLRGITFGLRVKPDDELLIREIIAKFYDDVEFSRVVRIGDDFGIDINDA